MFQASGFVSKMSQTSFAETSRKYRNFLQSQVLIMQLKLSIIQQTVPETISKQRLKMPLTVNVIISVRTSSHTIELTVEFLKQKQIKVIEHSNRIHLI